MTATADEQPAVGVHTDEGDTMKETKGSKSDAALGVGAVAVMALCCGGPVLIAGGALGAIGGFFSSPLVIAVGVALIAVALVAAAKRSGRGGDDCCDPAASPPRTHTTSEPTGR